MASRWTLGDIHGLPHWNRVALNGRRLLTDECNPLVVELFAYLHDSCRTSNGYDMEHGPRAAKWMETLRDNLLQGLTDEEFGLLQEAVRLHTVCHKTGNPTIDACFDADRLDLTRVGIVPNPNRMATAKGADMARKAIEKDKTDGRA